MPDVTLSEIPSPPASFLVGNKLDMKNATSTIEALTRLGIEHAPLFQWKEPFARFLIASGFEVVDELCDETRFDKSVTFDLEVARELVGDGLFSARTQEPNWGRAHNILLPCFSRNAILAYLPQMEDIAGQLIAKWDAAAAAGAPVDVPEDLTHMALDIVGLCGFGHRFESLTRTTPDPFMESFHQVLGELGAALEPSGLLGWLMPRKRRESDRAAVYAWVDALVAARRAAPTSGANDLLSLMLAGVDKKTGERLDDINIRYQIITFLFAGHETTSTLLSNAVYYLLKHPAALQRATAEADRVLGPDPNRPIEPSALPQLEYIARVLRETLRLWPSAPIIQVAPYEDTVVAGRYALKKGEAVFILLPSLHRDPKIWGPHADKFDPDRFLPEAEAARPANAYKPFGNGQRACIGRPFAMQEAIMVLARLVHRYRLVDHANYQHRLAEPLMTKPVDFKIKLERRTPASPAATPAATAPTETPASVDTLHAVAAHHTGLLVLYGSEMSSAEGFARRLCHDGLRLGFDAVVAPLDEYVDRLPREGVVVLVSSTYNGRPPDNASKFFHWLCKTPHASDAFRGVRYIVFGCGNREWSATYQAVSRAIDARLEEGGATRLLERGEADAGRDPDGDFERWTRTVWPALAAHLNLSLTPPSENGRPRFEVEVLADRHPNPFVPAFNAVPMTIIENRELQTREGPHASDRSTRHIEIALPPGVTYESGDHLGVIARNGKAAVARVAAHFQLTPESRVRLTRRDNEKTVLPLDSIVSVGSLLGDYLELGEVATRRHISVMVRHTRCPRTKPLLASLCGDDDESLARYNEQVLRRRLSIIDMLEEHPACELPFAVYLELLSPLRPRYYSISSSGLGSPRICSITVGVVDAPARSGRGQFEGICSTYLSRLTRGDTIHAFVRPASETFRLPRNPLTPIIMIGPGTGLAPFRGFLHERRALLAQGKKLGPAILFFGCRHENQDYLYREEMEAFARDGIAEIELAFSRQGDTKVYVQDRVAARAAELWTHLEDGAHVYICGDGSHMAPAVRAAFCEIHSAQTGGDAAAAEAWITDLMEQKRYLLDVWTST